MMYARAHRRSSLAGVAALTLAACAVDVRNEDSGGTAEVDVRSPVGSVSVRTNVEPSDTGLPVYPGARLLRGHDDTPESANVSVGGPWFGVKVVAATFESDDTPEQIVDFYRREMASHGDVVVCRGEADFRSSGPVCREDESSGDVQLVVGTEERHRMVQVEARDRGSKLALVYVQTDAGR